MQDTGAGLSEETKAHLFEPFFTTKAFGKGTGLGLAMCYGIVKQNAGQISVESKLGCGTTFHIYLPENEAALEAPREPRVPTPVRAGSETLLFVEDDDLVRQLAVGELANHGYRLIVARNGEEALRAAELHRGTIHLLVTDVIMPKMGGVELVRRFRVTRPETPVLFMSGYAEQGLEPGIALLQKPFTQADLLDRVRSLLDLQAGRADRASS